ncbi:hypothetical protein JG688_00010519 [Phytophthora aleatoria]|uniref:Putative zinc-finger domain-containing protein n=1 Tax=Phytophthora aleatoria TaxID=2496075 RepID=A0A8J5J5K8_9STRA|nr:hypothetical protein JG688_00010519 [Phytophthora aleatoria]
MRMEVREVGAAASAAEASVSSEVDLKAAERLHEVLEERQRWISKREEALERKEKLQKLLQLQDPTDSNIEQVEHQKAKEKAELVKQEEAKASKAATAVLVRKKELKELQARAEAAREKHQAAAIVLARSLKQLQAKRKREEKEADEHPRKKVDVGSKDEVKAAVATPEMHSFATAQGLDVGTAELAKAACFRIATRHLAQTTTKMIPRETLEQEFKTYTGKILEEVVDWGGAVKPASSKRIDPMKVLCHYELNGVCNDKNCSNYHQKDYQPVASERNNAIDCSTEDVDDIGVSVVKMDEMDQLLVSFAEFRARIMPKWPVIMTTQASSRTGKKSSDGKSIATDAPSNGADSAVPAAQDTEKESAENDGDFIALDSREEIPDTGDARYFDDINSRRVYGEMLQAKVEENPSTTDAWLLLAIYQLDLEIGLGDEGVNLSDDDHLQQQLLFLCKELNLKQRSAEGTRSVETEKTSIAADDVSATPAAKEGDGDQIMEEESANEAEGEGMVVVEKVDSSCRTEDDDNHIMVDESDDDPSVSKEEDGDQIMTQTNAVRIGGSFTAASTVANIAVEQPKEIIELDGPDSTDENDEETTAPEVCHEATSSKETEDSSDMTKPVDALPISTGDDLSTEGIAEAEDFAQNHSEVVTASAVRRQSSHDVAAIARGKLTAYMDQNQIDNRAEVRRRNPTLWREFLAASLPVNLELPACRLCFAPNDGHNQRLNSTVLCVRCLEDALLVLKERDEQSEVAEEIV